MTYPRVPKFRWHRTCLSRRAPGEHGPAVWPPGRAGEGRAARARPLQSKGEPPEIRPQGGRELGLCPPRPPSIPRAPTHCPARRPQHIILEASCRAAVSRSSAPPRLRPRGPLHTWPPRDRGCGRGDSPGVPATSQTPHESLQACGLGAPAWAKLRTRRARRQPRVRTSALAAPLAPTSGENHAQDKAFGAATCDHVSRCDRVRRHPLQAVACPTGLLRVPLPALPLPAARFAAAVSSSRHVRLLPTLLLAALALKWLISPRF